MATNESLVFTNKSIIGPTSVVVGAATFPQTTLQATGTTTLIGNVFVQGGALYPPGPMTAASTALSGYAYGNGTYVASAPEQSGSSSFQVWYAFDNSLTTTTESAGVYATSSPFAYSNTTPYAFSNTIDSGTTTTYNGVWHQLQMPSAIVLEYYTIFPRAGQETARSPATWRVFGSNDGTNWYTIDAQSSVTSWSAPQVSKTYYLSPLPATYSYFRLSVQNVNGSSGGILDIAQWNLYGKPPTPAMSILGGDLTIQSGGGLTVGPGTLGSNVVIFSNISGGANTFVMDSNARVSIGAGAFGGGSILSFGRPFANKVLTLYDVNSGDNPVTATNFYGFGIGTNLLRYQVASAANHGFYGASSEYARITSTGVSILTGANPTSNLQVTGNAYISNALTTTNVFANTTTLIGTTGQTTLNVTGNLYVSNAVTTTNIVAAGFTSNATNTIFNFDTLTIPFVNSTTLNVASTSNLQVATLTGTTGQPSLYVVGNVYVSNALATTNVSATTLTVTSAIGTFYGPHLGSNVGTFLNLYSANALTTTNVSAATVSTTNPISFRNRIINGDFIVDQRNAGAATTPTVDPTRAIDRWKVNIVGSGRCQVGQNLGAFASPSGFTSYFGMKVTTTSTPGTGDYFFVSQVIEGINAVDFVWGTASARSVTLSFWVQSSLTGTAGGFVRNAGTSASNYSRSYPFTFTITNALTWEYKTITIPGDTGTPWYWTQVDGIEFGIELWNGTAFQATAGAWAAGNFTGPSGGTINYAGNLNSNMNITGVQVELGPVATPYERRHVGLELGLCQRYYEPSIARLGGYHTAGNFLRSSVYFNTKKRPAASPIFTVISQLENSNMSALNFDNANFDQSSARILASATATGDAYGQWKVSVDCEF